MLFSCVNWRVCNVFGYRSTESKTQVKINVHKMCRYFRLQALFGNCVLSLFIQEKYFFVLALRLNSSWYSLFANEQRKTKQIQIGSWRIWYFYRTYRPCSWRHWYRQLTTLWQPSRSDFRDIKISIKNIKNNNEQTRNRVKNSHYFFSVFGELIKKKSLK